MRVLVLTKVFQCVCQFCANRANLSKWRKLWFFASVFQLDCHSISTWKQVQMFCNSLFFILPGALEPADIIVAGYFSQILLVLLTNPCVIKMQRLNNPCLPCGRAGGRIAKHSASEDQWFPCCVFHIFRFNILVHRIHSTTHLWIRQNWI